MNVLTNEISYQIIARTLILQREFQEIVSVLADHKIQVIALKGIALAQDITQDPGNRYIGDIDFLVRHNDVLSAVAILKAAGWSDYAGCYDPARAASEYLNSCILSKTTGIAVTLHLHWHLLNTTLPLFMYTIDMDEVWSNAETVVGQNFLRMQPHQLIVYLSIHGFNHSFSSKSLLNDIVDVVKYYGQNIDWNQVVFWAKAWNACTAVYAMIYLLGKKNMLNVSSEIIDQVKPKNSNQVEKIFDNVDQTSHNAMYSLYYFLAGSWINRMRFLFFSLFPPVSQMKYIYAAKKNTPIIFLYVQRLIWGIMQLISPCLSRLRV